MNDLIGVAALSLVTFGLALAFLWRSRVKLEEHRNDDSQPKSSLAADG